MRLRVRRRELLLQHSLSNDAPTVLSELLPHKQFQMVETSAELISADKLMLTAA